MRIISDFHDYYDAVQATGQDQSLIYFRKPETVEYRGEYPFPTLRYGCQNDDKIGVKVQQHTIGFCGKIYPAVKIHCIPKNQSAVCYRLEELDCFIEGHWRRKSLEEYRTKGKWRWKCSFWPGWMRREDFEKFFNDSEEKKDSFSKLFLEKHCPVWIGNLRESRWQNYSGEIIYNGCLKDLEFFRIFDTFSAYQEISMFLGGLAVPQKEIPEVSDKIMVGIKGFDEWSFRKPPRDK